MELSYILGNRNPEKILYILGSGTFFIFQETSYISRRNFLRSKGKQNLLLKNFS